MNLGLCGSLHVKSPGSIKDHNLKLKGRGRWLLKKELIQYYCNPIVPGHNRLVAIMITIIVIVDRLSLAHSALNCEHPFLPLHPWTFEFLLLVLGAPRGYCSDTCKTHL